MSDESLSQASRLCGAQREKNYRRNRRVKGWLGPWSHAVETIFGFTAELPRPRLEAGMILLES
jgi:hypothetical protein